VNANDDIVPEWAGTQQLGTSSDDYGSAVSVDSSNDIYVAGSTKGGLEGIPTQGVMIFFLLNMTLVEPKSGQNSWGPLEPIHMTRRLI
jgi:hypothetical protein